MHQSYKVRNCTYGVQPTRSLPVYLMHNVYQALQVLQSSFITLIRDNSFSYCTQQWNLTHVISVMMHGRS